jgi:hypothetical protein
MVIFEDANIESGNLVGSFIDSVATRLDLGAGSMLGIGFILMIGVVSFIASKEFSYDRALGVSGFITLISGFIILRLGWISNQIFVLVIIYFIIGLYYLIKERGGEEI